MTLSPNDPTFDPFMTGALTAAAIGPSTPSTTSFAPGAIVAGRYRLVALLGRGGMGEVYRADDLTLNHPVALKFLPEAVTAGDARLAQFHNELRTARQVSHRSVCRLYDLGEANGRRFLTMEYVDGEDLGSLLRRIGRIPQDKAIEIARQLCAGVAAAHDRGVLHRDLKPSNVMIDGEGNVRITDFGIATASDQAGDDFAGTPQYMAPEQFAGRAASIKSDIYALGLILFEIFTGKRAVDSKTLADLKDFHKTGTVATPSSIVRDLDPAVERVILRCLDKEPERRPASALVVAAALPGADPLAAALAAGETPSPEILAAAGETDALGVLPGVAMVALTLAGLLVFASVSSRSSTAGRAPLDLPPAVLVDRAQRILASFGYPVNAGDDAYEFVRSPDYARSLYEAGKTPQGRSAAVAFWYRTSPRSLQPIGQSRVSLTDPPLTATDMRTVVLDGRGRLQEFRAVPPQVESDNAAAAPSPSWDRIFDAAGLPMAAFTPVTPQWTPRDYADTRAAWEGPLTGNEAIRVRVEASAYRGKPVHVAIVGPWTRPTLMTARQQSAIDRAITAGIVVIVALLFVVAGLLARRNLRAGRADRRGAARLAAFVATAGCGAWLLAAHHGSTIKEEFDSLFQAAGPTALTAALLWAIYIALEPYVRKLWPDSLLGWSRLVAGHVRDPRVGRDVLIGATVGVALNLVDVGRVTIIPWLGYQAPTATFGRSVEALAGPGVMGGTWLRAAIGSVQASLLLVLIVVLIRLTLRRVWLALPVTVLMLSVPDMAEMGTTNTPLVLLFALACGALFTWLLLRSGLLAFAVAWLVWSTAGSIPMMQDVSHWSAAAGNWTLAAVVGLALFGFYASRAGQPLFGSILKD